MKETSKCYEMRKARGDFDKYLRGNGVDIGCGDDCLRVEQGTVRPWDVADGDAMLMAGIPDASLDFVYSSHCLEHVRNVETALTHWTRILKPGGFLYVVVPDYILYEKMTWPSRFNGDHKQSFSFLVTRNKVMRENHFNVQLDLLPLLKRLGLESLEVRLEDDRFNYNFGLADQTRYDALAQLCFVAKKL